MNPNTPDFIPDNKMPDFIPDEQMDKMDKIVRLTTEQAQGPQGPAGAVRGVSDVMREIGLGAIPDAAGEVTALFTGRKVQSDNPFMSPERFKSEKEKGIVKRTVENAAGMGSWMVPEIKALQGAGLAAKAGNLALRGVVRGELYGTSQDQPFNPVYPAVGALAEPLVGAMRSGMLTKKGAYSKMEQAAEKGVDIKWDSVADMARTAAKNKPTSTKIALERLLSTERPVPDSALLTAENAANYTIPDSALSSSKALELRGELGSRLSKDIFGNLKIPISSGEQNATNILRRIVSGELKKSAPGISTPDRVYRLYSQLHGDVPTWAKRIILLETAKYLGKDMPIIGPFLKQVPLPQ